MTKQAELHNELARTIVESIVMPPLKAGGSMADVLILTESVLLGVILTCANLGGNQAVLDKLTERVKLRLAEGYRATGERLSNRSKSGEG